MMIVGVKCILPGLRISVNLLNGCTVSIVLGPNLDSVMLGVLGTRMVG